MEQRYELANGDTFVITDAVRNRLANLGLNEAASTEILDGMRTTVETWVADEFPHETNVVANQKDA